MGCSGYKKDILLQIISSIIHYFVLAKVRRHHLTHASTRRRDFTATECSKLPLRRRLSGTSSQYERTADKTAYLAVYFTMLLLSVFRCRLFLKPMHKEYSHISQQEAKHLIFELLLSEACKP